MTVTEPAPAKSSDRGRRDYPGPSLLAVPGLLRKLWFDRLAMLTDAANEFGDVVKFAMGPKTLYFFNHPDHAKHVLADNAANYHKGIGLAEARRLILGDGLLTSEDEVWKHQRRIIQPAFRRDRLAGFASVVTDAGQALVARLSARVGDTVDMSEEMTRLTMSVLGKSLLDADLSPLRMLGPAFEVAQDRAMFEMVSLGAVPLWLPLPRNHRFRRARAQLEDAVQVLVAGRAYARGGDGTDLLSMLADAYSGERDARKRWRVLGDEIITILLAGHETTASTLSWTWYLLSGHPETEAALHAEAVEVLPAGRGSDPQVARRRRGRRLPGPGGRRRDDLPVHPAPAPWLLAGSRRIPAGAVRALSRGSPAQVRLHPLRRRSARLRRERPRLDGGDPDRGHGGARLPVRARRRRPPAARSHAVAPGTRRTPGQSVPRVTAETTPLPAE